MNELQRRFHKKTLTVQQKELMLDTIKNQPNKRFTFVPIVVPSFIVVATMLMLIIFNTPLTERTTAATSSTVMSLNFFLNTCNMLLIVGICMHIVKLMKDGQWKLPRMFARIIPKTAIIWIVVLITLYGMLESFLGLTTYYKESMFILLFLLLLTLYYFFPSESIVGTKVISKRKLLIASSIAYFVCCMMYWSIDALTIINATASVMGFPTAVNWEAYPLGRYGAWLFVLGMIGIFLSLKKYRALILTLLIFVYYAVPGTVQLIQQSFLAEDAAAIHSYKDGMCSYNDYIEQVVEYRCEITLKNRSNEAATFSLEMYQPRKMADDYASIEILNEEGPFTYRFAAKETRKVVIEGTFSMKHLPEEQQLYSGSTVFNVKLFSEKFEGYQ